MTWQMIDVRGNTWDVPDGITVADLAELTCSFVRQADYARNELRGTDVRDLRYDSWTRGDVAQAWRHATAADVVSFEARCLAIGLKKVVR